MTKKEVIKTVASKLNMSFAAAKDVVETTFDTIKDGIFEANKIEVRGFGIFSLATRRGRQGRNPKTGEAVTIKDRKVVKFRPGQELTKRAKAIAVAE